MNRLRYALLPLLGMASAVAAPVKLADIPAGSAWFGHLDVDAALSGKSFAALRDASKLPPDVAARMDEFTVKTGLDPKRDVHGFTVFGDGSATGTTILVYHSGSSAKLRALLQAEKSAESDTIDGVAMMKVHGSKKNGGFMYVASDDNRPLVLSDSGEAVAKAVKAFGGKGVTPSSEWSKAVSGSIPMLVLSADMAGLPLDKAQSEQVKAARSVTLVVTETGDLLELSLKATMVDAASAEKAAGVVKAVQSMALSSASDTAQKDDATILLRSLKISTSGETLAVALPVAVSDLRRVLDVRVGSKTGTPATAGGVSKK